MGLIRALTAKPWTQTAEDLPAWGRLPQPTPWVGLCVFLAVVTTLFLLLASAYLMRMVLGDWVPMPVPPLLWLNTLLLVVGCVALHGAWSSARRGRRAAVRTGFLIGGGCTLAFLAGQLVAWRQLAAVGYLVATNPANTFFYLLTALHGLHLLGGLVAWGRTAIRLGPEADVFRMRQSIGLCAVYWHFLLLVWVVLFALLLADDAGAASMAEIIRSICYGGIPGTR